ncbi:MAG TPA: hypothetical protein VNW04_07260 [Puia sp.]|nr:hypothetical protein [Puia sp.]
MLRPFAQKARAEKGLLTPAQVANYFPDSVRRALHINIPIFRVYHYGDKSGQYYCVLTESLDSVGPANDSFHYNIRAVNLRQEKGAFVKAWECNDLVARASYETSIWFWTRYCEFRDYDHDSLVEPLII